MELQGKCKGLSYDILTNEVIVSFSTNVSGVDVQKQWDDIKGNDKLDIIAKIHREKRSLDANAYFHVLVGKISDKLRISKPRCKNILIGRYGQLMLLDKGEVATVKSNISVDVMLEQEILHCLCCGTKVEPNGAVTNFYRIYRGSHTYDTKEMSILIDGTVSEAKELGIETLPPEELERMYLKWVAKN